MWVVRHGAAAGLTVLQQVRRAGQVSRSAEYKQVTVRFAELVIPLGVT